MKPKKALEGIRVLDLSQFLSGPRAAQMLGDMGAEVIKIEPPGGETMRALAMLMPGSDRVIAILNRNKRGVTLNLRTEAGREIFRRLVAVSDVLIENFTPGTMDKLGLGYEDLRKLNPKLVYGVVSGFGLTGPYASRTAFDIVAQATGGLMHANRREDRTPTIFIADLVGGVHLATGILEALLYRERGGGEGQLVDVSMQDVVYTLHYQALSDRALAPVEKEISDSLGRPVVALMTNWDHPLPFWYSYQAKDGYVVIVALTDKQWQALGQTIGCPEFAEDPHFSNFVDRIRNSSVCREKIQAWIGTKTMDEAVDALAGAGVPCGAVNDIGRLHRDPQLLSREMLVEAEHGRLGSIAIPGIPIKLSETPGSIENAGPDLGEHTGEVLTGLLGIGAEEIERLRAEGAI